MVQHHTSEMWHCYHVNILQFLVPKFLECIYQGHQIGRIYAYWAIVSLGQLFENYRRSQPS
jgi:hypothetical protein